MNTRLKKKLSWSCGLVYNQHFCVNYYQCEIGMITATTSSEEQNVAYERMKYWLYRVLTDSIFIHEKDPSVEIWQATEQRLLILPDEPVDQIMGMTLFQKLNAIMEKRIVVTDLELRSSEGDNVSYLHNQNENISQGLSKEGWWNDSRPIWSNKTREISQKIVKLDHLPEWKDFDLDWDSSKKESNTVLFADFSNNADK